MRSGALFRDRAKQLPWAILLCLVNGCGSAASNAESQAVAPDACPRSAAVVAAPNGGPLYTTAAAFEHHDIGRSQVFPDSCTLLELSGGAPPEIAVRTAPGYYLTPYIAQTRDRDQLYLYGYGPQANLDGAYVAAIDPGSLNERWRTSFSAPTPEKNQQPWSWPGVATIHGNGFVYAVYANQFYKLDPATGAILAQRSLPQGPYGAVYNGMDVLPDGRLVTKNMEEAACPLLDFEKLISGNAAVLLHASVFPETFGGLICYLLFNKAPSTLVVLDPDKLDLVAQVTLPEPITGRVSVESHDGLSYIYVAGSSAFYRYIYDGAQLAPDQGWGPVAYVEPGQGPAAGAAMMDGFAIIQNTGYARAGSIVAVDIRDAAHRFRIDPFPLVPGVPLGPSFVLSKPAADPDNHLVVAVDVLAARMGAFRLDPVNGFTTVWTAPVFSLAFPALTGPPEHRQIVIPDSLALGMQDGRQTSLVVEDRVRWLDEATGKRLAASPVLSFLPAPGNIVTPGFNGRFYYAGADGKFRELSVTAGGS